MMASWILSPVGVDLHWIDSETQGFLDNLIESLPTAQLLLLVNYRIGLDGRN